MVLLEGRIAAEGGTSHHLTAWKPERHGAHGDAGLRLDGLPACAMMPVERPAAQRAGR